MRGGHLGKPMGTACIHRRTGRLVATLMVSYKDKPGPGLHIKEGRCDIEFQDSYSVH